MSSITNKGKKLVIIGNAKNVTFGPIQQKVSPRFLNQFINQADIVIRMNNIKNNKSRGIGSRTDILAIMNTGKPMYLDPDIFPRKILKGLKEILFVVPPKEIEIIYSSKTGAPDEDPNHGIQFADLILKCQGWNGMCISYTDDNQMLQLTENLGSISKRSCMPSTGIRVVEHVLRMQRFHEYKKYLVGFGFEGWPGHAFDAEKIYIQNLLEQKILHVPELMGPK